MGKKQIAITIDEDIHKIAQEQKLNISAIADRAIYEATKTKKILITESLKCEFCGREGIKETKETINQNPNGLTWLWPDEKWICNSCLRSEARIRKK